MSGEVAFVPIVQLHAIHDLHPSHVSSLLVNRQINTQRC